MGQPEDQQHHWVSGPGLESEPRPGRPAIELGTKSDPLWGCLLSIKVIFIHPGSQKNLGRSVTDHSGRNRGEKHIEKPLEGMASGSRSSRHTFPMPKSIVFAPRFFGPKTRRRGPLIYMELCSSVKCALLPTPPTKSEKENNVA